AVVLAHDLAADALTLPVAAGGVDEVHAEFDRPVQRADGLVLLRADPPRSADAPRPVADLGDRQARLAERTIMHASSCEKVFLDVYPTGAPADGPRTPSAVPLPQE